jgi:hypothetical protein
MLVEFVKDWIAYRAGATAEVDTLGAGVVDILLARGIVKRLTPVATAAPPIAGKTAATPKPARRK